MENRESVLGATSIIGGTLLQISSLMMGNWLGFLAAIIGFYLIFSGMGKLQAGFDSAGRSALGMLRLGMIVMLVGSLLDAIPGIGILAPGLYLIAFVVEILAYSKLKTSASLGPDGKSGAGMLMQAVIIGVLFSILDIVPYLGEAIAGVTALFIILLSFYGWRKIQEDLLRRMAGQ